MREKKQRRIDTFEELLNCQASPQQSGQTNDSQGTAEMKSSPFTEKHDVCYAIDPPLLVNDTEACS